MATVPLISSILASETFTCTWMRRYDVPLVKFLEDITFLSKKYLNQMTEKHLQKTVKNASELSIDEINLVMKGVQKQKITNLYQISKKSLTEIIKAVERQFDKIEQEAPAAGYRLRIEAGTLNEVEIYIEAYGDREIGTLVKMPKLTSSCPFCAKVANQDEMEKYKNFCSYALSKVIQTSQMNPLIISTGHKDSFFQLSTVEKVSMIRTAYKVFLAHNSEGKNFLFHTHYGEGLNLGHQNVPHAHGHVKGALTPRL